MNMQDNIRLKVPRQQLDQSSYFDTETSSVDQWVAQLPMANLGQATRQLYQALSELNQVRMLPTKRMMILEKLLPPVQVVSRSLNKRYINQPIILPEQPRKVADLANALHSQLATGYTIVATHIAALGDRASISNPEILISTALHRAITNLSVNLRRQYQIYQPINDGTWNNLHQFYRLAHQHGILNHDVEDTEHGSCSVEQSYIRALLMGCCKPNQIRQEDFIGIFKPLTQWTKLCQLNTRGNHSLFIVDTSSDQPPIYREIYEASLNEYCVCLDTIPLSKQLQISKEKTSITDLKVDINDTQISLDLLGHLILAWGSMSKRTFMRVEANDALELCVGLSATHHFVSGELKLEALIKAPGTQAITMPHENPFLKLQTQPHTKDVWDTPFEANTSIETIDFHSSEDEQNNSEPSQKYTSSSVQIINSSAKGYCVKWPEDAEAFIKTGEIVGIKEGIINTWSIAVIRWVRHPKGEETQLGLELISPGATAYGARIIRKTGGPGDYIRVLVLPEMLISKQPITLLTPKVPFKAKNKVVLNQRGNEIQINLTNKLNASGAYNQFEFKQLSSIHNDLIDGAQNHDDKNMDDFDLI
jgi:hypothetical protein